MSCGKSIRVYGGECCGGVRADKITGIVQNSYTRRADGTFVRADGLDLTSGFRNRSLLAVNGSKAASQIFDDNEAPLCCKNPA